MSTGMGTVGPPDRGADPERWCSGQDCPAALHGLLGRRDLAFAHDECVVPGIILTEPDIAHLTYMSAFAILWAVTCYGPVLFLETLVWLSWAPVAGSRMRHTHADGPSRRPSDDQAACSPRQEALAPPG